MKDAAPKPDLNALLSMPIGTYIDTFIAAGTPKLSGVFDRQGKKYIVEVRPI